MAARRNAARSAAPGRRRHRVRWRCQLYQAILERRPQRMIAQLKEMLVPSPIRRRVAAGELRFGWAGRRKSPATEVASQESWRQARLELEPLLKEQPDNDSLLGDLALVSMGLGDKSSAFAFAERAMAANPIDKDAVGGPVLARDSRPGRGAPGRERPCAGRLGEITFATLRWCNGGLPPLTPRFCGWIRCSIRCGTIRAFNSS